MSENGLQTRGLRAGALVTLVSAALLGGPASATAQSLEGSWSGGGRVLFPSGETERARCRASFRRQGGESYAMSATCATQSARVQQTAVLVRTGPNRYAGDFNNAEYGITGSIRVTVSGRSLNASLSGGGGSAQFSLSK
jgi:hypothetical protein